MKDPVNLIITGVGGQGNILASQIVAQAAIEEGWFVSIGETYGASQRGGSVMSHLRLSREFQYGPLIPKGDADVILGFEPLETMRVLLEFGNNSTRIITNPRPTYPIGVLAGTFTYPPLEDLLGALKKTSGEVLIIEATKIAQKKGIAVAQNVVMVGALAGSGYLPMSVKSYEDAIREIFDGEKLELNLDVFKSGLKGIAKKSE